MQRLIFIGIFLCQLFAIPAWAQNDYGVVDLVDGQVTVLGSDGNSYNPNIGDVVHEGDLLTTGSDGEMHITTVDQGITALRPNTRLKIEAYRAEHDKDDKSLLMLLQGRFRSVTGWIGHGNSPNYQIRTPTAVVGVRGTDHEPAFISEADVTAGVAAKAGTYDKVNDGETYIENSKGRIAVKPNESGFAPLRAALPVLLTAIPNFYQPTQFEDDIKQRAEDLKQKLLEKPLAIKQQADEIKQDPKEAAKQKIMEKMQDWQKW